MIRARTAPMLDDFLSSGDLDPDGHGPASVVLDQAEHRLYAPQALLVELLGVA